MLTDEHFKVIKYWDNSSNVFSNVEIKGGVAITLYDKKVTFGAIGTFSSFEQLNSIVQKVAVLEKARKQNCNAFVRPV